MTMFICEHVEEISDAASEYLITVGNNAWFRLCAEAMGVLENLTKEKYSRTFRISKALSSRVCSIVCDIKIILHMKLKYTTGEEVKVLVTRGLQSYSTRVIRQNRILLVMTQI